jgi:hypothetical protein
VCDYDELCVRILSASKGYRVVASSAVGVAAGEMQLPVAPSELENFVLKLGRPRQGRRRLDSPELRVARPFGCGLFDPSFQGEIRDAYQIARDRSDALIGSGFAAATAR